MPAIMATDEQIVLQGTPTYNRQQPHTGPTLCHPVRSDRISISRSDSASYALSLLIHNGFKPGEGAAFNSRGAACEGKKTTGDSETKLIVEAGASKGLPRLQGLRRREQVKNK